MGTTRAIPRPRRRRAWRAFGYTRHDGWQDPHGSVEPRAFCAWATTNAAQVPAVAAIACASEASRGQRGDVGAALALEVAQQVLLEHAGLIDWSTPRRQATLLREDLPTRIVSAWTQKVDTHRRQMAIDEVDRAASPRRDDRRPPTNADGGRAGNDAALMLDDDDGAADRLLRAYDATLVAAMVTDSALLVLQIGDGQTIVFDDSREAILGPIDLPLSTRRATLGQRDAARRFMTANVPLPDRDRAIAPGSWPRLVLLGCQTCVDRFETPDALIAAGRHLIDRLDAGPPERGGRMLAELLEALPAQAGDPDLTAAILHACGPDT